MEMIKNSSAIWIKIWHLLGTSTPSRYILAATAMFAAILLRYTIAPIIGQQQAYITFFPAIILTAMLVGFWPTIIMGVLSIIWIEYFLTPPFGIHLDIAQVDAVIMVLAAALAGLLGQRMRFAQWQAQIREQKVNELAGKLEARTNELESIIRIVSHDLRAPLVNVRGFNAFLKKDCRQMNRLLAGANISSEVRNRLDAIINNEMPEATGFIDKSAGAMNELVETLVKVTRAGMVVPKPEMLDVNCIFKDILDSIKIKFTQTGTVIDVTGLPSCFADKAHVTQVFTNLLENAVKYLDPGRKGLICVSGRSQGHDSIYEIADNGIGIAPEHQEKIFDVYYRISEKENVDGQGIGLSIVKSMVDRNNGRIWFISEKGRGSIFYVSLPASPH